MRPSSALSREKKLDWLAFPVFAVLVVFFYWKVLLGHSIFVFVDASRFFFPLWKWGAGVLHSGVIPLWNPDVQFGAPYFADPQMAYAYPPVFLLYSFLSPINAFAGLVILHHLWTLLGFWVFARGQGFSRKGSLVGALIFGFSLHLVCSSWVPVALMTISWIPWIFWAAQKVFEGVKGSLLYLSLAWAMQLAAGYPVLTYLTGLALGLHYLWKTLLPWKKFSVSKLGWMGWFGLAALVAAAYNLVWGLPFLEFYRLSNYRNGPGHLHDLGWPDFATLLAPFFQGHPLRDDYHGPHYWVSTYFVGLPTLCLLFWVVLKKKARQVSWGVLPVLLVLSLGILGAGKLLRVILPGYSLVIHSGYWLSFLTFWVAWMGTEAVDPFLGTHSVCKNVLTWLAAVVVVYGASLFLQTPVFAGAFWFSFALLLVSVFFPALLRMGFFLTALVLSLGVAAISLNILLDRSYYEKPPEILSKLAKPGRLFFTPPLIQEAGVLRGASMEGAYEGAKQKLYPNWPLGFGREQAPFYNTLQLNYSSDWTSRAFQYSPAFSRMVLDYLGIRYVFGKNQFKDFRKINGPEASVEISENPSPLPKWFSVSKAFGIGYSARDEFLVEGGRPINLAKECFLADYIRQRSYQPRLVAFWPEGPNRLSVVAAGKGKALVISSETAYPGWKVRVMGKERLVERINFAFRGVSLEDGESAADFSYEPAPFRLGLFLSLLVCGFWGGLLLKTKFPI